MNSGEQLAQPPATVKVRLTSVLAYGVGRLVPGLILLVSVPIWIHLFGLGAYGVFSVIQASMLVCSALGAGWLRQAALRFAGRPGYGLLDHPPSLLLGAVVSTGAATCVGADAALGWSLSSLGPLAMTGLFASSYGAYLLSQTPLQRDGAVVRFNAAEVVRAVVPLLMSLVLAREGASGFGPLVTSATVGNVLAIAVTARPRAAAHSLARHASRWGVARSSWSFGWPLSVWLGISSLTIFADRFVLSLAFSPSELGSYTATADLVSRGFTMLALPIVMAVHPVLMHEHNAGRTTSYAATLRRWSGILLVFVLAAVVALAAVGPEVTSLLFGQATMGRPSLALLALGTGLWQYSALAHKPLEIAHKTRAMLGYATMALVFEVFFSVSIVRVLGVLGVVSGLVLGALIYLALVSRAVRRSPDI